MQGFAPLGGQGLIVCSTRDHGAPDGQLVAYRLLLLYYFSAVSHTWVAFRNTRVTHASMRRSRPRLPTCSIHSSPNPAVNQCRSYRRASHTAWHPSTHLTWAGGGCSTFSGAPFLSSQPRACCPLWGYLKAQVSRGCLPSHRCCVQRLKFLWYVCWSRCEHSASHVAMLLMAAAL